MKKQTVKTPLRLKKEVVAALPNAQMNQVAGGQDLSLRCTRICPQNYTYNCPSINNC